MMFFLCQLQSVLPTRRTEEHSFYGFKNNSIECIINTKLFLRTNSIIQYTRHFIHDRSNATIKWNKNTLLDMH